MKIVQIDNGVWKKYIDASEPPWTHKPDPPTNLILTENGDVVEIQFDVSPDPFVTRYEIWSSVGIPDEYSLIGTIKPEDIVGGQAFFVDDSYEAISTVWYRVYAIYQDNYSTPLSGSIVLTFSVPDPTDLKVTPHSNAISLNWVNDESRLLDYIEVKKDAQTVQGNLNEGSAVLVYRGKASGFTYQVPDLDLGKWHQFWISSFTKII